MSNTYARSRKKKMFDKLAENSADVMDYRARLCYIAMRQRHPKWNPSFVKALAEWKGILVTVFQRPLERNAERRMKRRLRRARRRIER